MRRRRLAAQHRSSGDKSVQDLDSCTVDRRSHRCRRLEDVTVDLVVGSGGVPAKTETDLNIAPAPGQEARITVSPGATDSRSPGPAILTMVGASEVQVAAVVTSVGVPGGHGYSEQDTPARQPVADPEIGSQVMMMRGNPCRSGAVGLPPHAGAPIAQSVSAPQTTRAR